MKKIFLLVSFIISSFILTGFVSATPQWLGNETETASPATWDCSVTYRFYVNWTDSVGGFDNATFQLGSPDGSLTNYTTATTPATWNYSVVIWGINITQDSLIVGTYNFTWFGINTTGVENSTDTWTYTIDKATPNLRANWVNDTYININQSFSLTANLTDDSCWYKYTNFTIYATVQNVSATGNYSLSIQPNLNYTFDFDKTELGEVSSDCGRINITYIYIIGNANYTTTTNTSTLYSDYGRTNALTVIAPTSAEGGSSMTFKTNYTTTEDSLITELCQVAYRGSTTDMSYSSGYQTATVTARSDTGTDTWTLSCSNSSYQTQSDSGSVSVSGISGGGGPSPTTTSTTTTTTISEEELGAVCGNGKCEEGESWLICSEDCKFLETGKETGDPISDIEEGEEIGVDWGLVAMVLVGIIIIVVIVFVVKKIFF